MHNLTVILVLVSLSLSLFIIANKIYKKREGPSQYIHNTDNTLQNREQNNNFTEQINISEPYIEQGYSRSSPYSPSNPGPIVGSPMNVPVPMKSLKDTNEWYNFKRIQWGMNAVNMNRAEPVSFLDRGMFSANPVPFASQLLPSLGVIPGSTSNFPITNSRAIALQSGSPASVDKLNFTDFDNIRRPNTSNDWFSPYRINRSSNDVGFFGRVNSFAPFPEINTFWEKAGIVTSKKGEDGKEEIMNLYRRPIAPMQDIWEYQVQDKNGFVIKLATDRYLEDGNIVKHIPGKPSPGGWKTHIFAENKWVWA